MEGGSAATMNGNEDSTKKGLDGTGLDLPLNRHGNLKSASSDQSLKDILLQIKSSKTPIDPCFLASQKDRYGIGGKKIAFMGLLELK
ncbi:thioredoxin-like 3-3 [Castanea sativa]|uniref:thioredoxin-like 3-3 n=1 Tax=Castanea sativa TaxID=21020 RepID=UPI003F64ECA1